MTTQSHCLPRFGHAAAQWTTMAMMLFAFGIIRFRAFPMVRMPCPCRVPSANCANFSAPTAAANCSYQLRSPLMTAIPGSAGLPAICRVELRSYLPQGLVSVFLLISFAFCLSLVIAYSVSCVLSLLSSSWSGYRLWSRSWLWSLSSGSTVGVCCQLLSAPSALDWSAPPICHAINR